jgi:hypothetical protein
MLQWFQPTLEEDEFLLVSQEVVSAAARLTGEGTPIRHLASALSCPDEMAFCLLDGPSLEAAREVGTRAGLLIDRVTEAVFTSGPLHESRSRGGHQRGQRLAAAAGARDANDHDAHPAVIRGQGIGLGKRG